jgi:hypothetical protein
VIRFDGWSATGSASSAPRTVKPPSELVSTSGGAVTPSRKKKLTCPNRTRSPSRSVVSRSIRWPST